MSCTHSRRRQGCQSPDNVVYPFTATTGLSVSRYWCVPINGDDRVVSLQIMLCIHSRRRQGCQSPDNVVYPLTATIGWSVSRYWCVLIHGDGERSVSGGCRVPVHVDNREVSFQIMSCNPSRRRQGGQSPDNVVYTFKATTGWSISR